jgi:hypothetical protein
MRITMHYVRPDGSKEEVEHQTGFIHIDSSSIGFDEVHSLPDGLSAQVHAHKQGQRYLHYIQIMEG